MPLAPDQNGLPDGEVNMRFFIKNDHNPERTVTLLGYVEPGSIGFTIGTHLDQSKLTWLQLTGQSDPSQGIKPDIHAGDPGAGMIDPNTNVSAKPTTPSPAPHKEKHKGN